MEGGDWSGVIEVILRMVNEEMNNELVKEVSEEEIVKPVFQLGTLEAPRPNGFNGLFYQKYWEIVKDSVVETVKSFFHSSHMLRELNTINVVLVTKARKLEEVAHFRPISCYNFVYKIISKMMVNRLKPFMEELIT